MVGAALPGRLNWQLGTVVELVDETARTKTIMLDVPQWQGHQAGQHIDVRLTAEDGYQAQRSYSIASAPEDSHVAITVERLDDGEVSPYLVDVLMPGDEVELRGPIGGYFVWDGAMGSPPLLMLAGGSGVVPFRSMLRHRMAVNGDTPTRLVYSSRSLGDVIYRGELSGTDGGVDVEFVLTRDWPDDWTGHRGRLGPELLRNLAWPADQQPAVYICGPNAFVEAMASGLVEQGHNPRHIKTERFGPTGN